MALSQRAVTFWRYLCIVILPHPEQCVYVRARDPNLLWCVCWPAYMYVFVWKYYFEREIKNLNSIFVVVLCTIRKCKLHSIKIYIKLYRLSVGERNFLNVFFVSLVRKYTIVRVWWHNEYIEMKCSSWVENKINF